MIRRSVLVGGGAVVAAGAALAVASHYSTGSTEAYDLAMKRLRAPLPQGADAADLIRYATLAANSHNTQPWRFQVAVDRISVLPDPSRRTPVVDPDDHHLFVSLGCAAENLCLAAGCAGEPILEPSDRIAVAVPLGKGANRSSPLFAAIPYRRSTRAEYDGRALAVDELAGLNRAAAVVGVETVLITDRALIGLIRDLIIAANTVQIADPAFVAELKHWIRFNPRDAMRTGDGLYAAATGNPVLPAWVGSPLFDLVFRVDAENDRCARHVDSSAGLAVFVATSPREDGWVKAGRACQRFGLAATAFGLRTAFLNQPVEVERFRPELAALIGAPGLRPSLIMRFGRGPDLPYSPRRPVAEVMA